MSDVSFSGPSLEKAAMVISCRKQIGLDQRTVEVVRYMMLLRILLFLTVLLIQSFS